MLLLKTALKNILGGGKKTWLNVAVISFTMVVMVGMIALIDGWMAETKTNTRDWETGDGQWWHPAYDRYDLFTLQDAHGVIPQELSRWIADGDATPQLIMQATLYPQGRMHNIILRGVDPSQTLLALPSEMLLREAKGYLPILIGSRMAQASKLTEGEVVMLRWRDRNGVFDAREAMVVGVFGNKVPAIDSGQVWVSLDDLYAMTGMHNEATLVITSPACPVAQEAEGWRFRDLSFLMADIEAMISAQWVEAGVIFLLLTALCLLAIYDTQTLSIFHRQKEIGTYVALGMTPRQVIALFTLEGTLFCLLAIGAGLIWGAPLLYLFGKVGMAFPGSYEALRPV